MISTNCLCYSSDCNRYGCARHRNPYPPAPAPSLPSQLPSWDAQAINNLADAIRELARALAGKTEA